MMQSIQEKMEIRNLGQGRVEILLSNNLAKAMELGIGNELNIEELIRDFHKLFPNGKIIFS